MSAQRHSAAIGGGETVKACASKQVATAAKSSKSTDPSPLQSAAAAGEPPYMARKKYDHKLLESLAKGDKLVDKAAELAAATPTAPAISIQWVIGLGVLLLISILINFMMYLRG